MARLQTNSQNSSSVPVFWPMPTHPQHGAGGRGWHTKTGASPARDTAGSGAPALPAGSAGVWGKNKFMSWDSHTKMSSTDSNLGLCPAVC